MTNKESMVAVTLAMLAAIMIAPWISRPFTGHHDFTGAFNSQIARNYLRYGLVKTKLGQITNFGFVSSPDQFTFHTHHPPGVPLILALTYRLFGEHEWVARGTTALFALGSVFLFFRLVYSSFSFSSAVVSTLILISSPLFIYPSILPVYESPALFLILLQLYLYSRLRETGRKTDWILLATAAAVGAATAWATYFAIPLLVLNELRLRRKVYLKRLLVLIGLNITIFTAHLAHTRLLTGDWFGGGLANVFLLRVVGQGEVDPRYVYSSGRYLTKLSARLNNFYGWPLLALLTIGGLSLVRRRKEDQDSLAFFLFGLALSLPVAFRNYVFIHDYTLYYTAPFVGLGAAVGLTFIVRRAAVKIAGKPPSRQISAIACVSIILLNTLTIKDMWRDLWSSIEWDETSLIIGSRLRELTGPADSILVMNAGLKDEETQLAYYADRQLLFPPPTGMTLEALGDPDAIVLVTSDQQFKPEVKSELLQLYRLEVDRGVEYYYRN